ncbi:heparan-alpha-glucosaminide N-acetyltransferase domain-containing protein [Timonella sp. A28]|uniref:heparan-alpha-glucosaminide N-acetyltransferase domain-containing protein n=1 Tax=Timonella sp. A28 TaxID=3442640 RepID=UPI003EB6F990
MTETVALAPAEPTPSAPARTRIYGIDLARSLALMGMIAAHFAVADSFVFNKPETWGALAHGRSSILFATLAGVSLAIMSGRTERLSGQALVDARLRILVRALVIFAIGSLLIALNSGIAVILQMYAVLFIVALPFLAARRRTLVIAAAIMAVVGPLIVAVLESLPFFKTTVSFPAAEIFISGTYPLFSWVSFILIGLAVGRTNLASLKNVLIIGAIGIGMMTAGYATVPLFSQATPEAVDIEEETYSSSEYEDIEDTEDTTETYDTPNPADLQPGEFFVNGEPTTALDLEGLDCYDETYEGNRNIGCSSITVSEDETFDDGTGTPDFWATFNNHLSEFGTADPHSGTPNEIVGSGGVALLVIALCILLCRRIHIIFWPLLAMGSMSLSVYALHVITFRLVERTSLFTFESFAWDLWLGTIILAIIMATIFRLTTKKGPLEMLVNWIVKRTTTARD